MFVHGSLNIPSKRASGENRSFNCMHSWWRSPVLDYRCKFSYKNLFPSTAVAKPFPLSHKTAENFYKTQLCFQPDSSYEFGLQGPTWPSSCNVISDKGDVCFTQEPFSMALSTTSSTKQKVGDKPRRRALLLPGICSHHSVRCVVCKRHQSQHCQAG